MEFGKNVYNNELLIEIISLCNNIENGIYSEVNYEDILIYYNYIESKLNEIKTIEDEYNYNYQVLNSFSIIEKKKELIITPDMYYEINQLKHDNIINNTELFKEKFTEVTIVALKFQYKHYLRILDDILTFS